MNDLPALHEMARGWGRMPSVGRCVVAVCIFAALSALGFIPMVTDFDVWCDVQYHRADIKCVTDVVEKVGMWEVLPFCFFSGCLVGLLYYGVCVLVTLPLLRFRKRIWLQGVVPMLLVAGFWYAISMGLHTAADVEDTGPVEYEGCSLLFLKWGMAPETIKPLIAWLKFPLMLILPYTVAQWYLLRGCRRG